MSNQTLPEETPKIPADPAARWDGIPVVELPQISDSEWNRLAAIQAAGRDPWTGRR